MTRGTWMTVAVLSCLMAGIATAPDGTAHEPEKAPGTAKRKIERAREQGRRPTQREVQAVEDAEVAALARQPARVLAQQAHALLHIRRDAHEAGVRLEAALKSADRREVDIAVLRNASATLGRESDPERVMDLIDTALSRPLGAESGKLFHGAGREFAPAKSAQETVAVAAGAALLLAGALMLALRRRPTRAR